MLSDNNVDVQVAALEEKLAMEAKMRAEAERALDQERRSFSDGHHILGIRSSLK